MFFDFAIEAQKVQEAYCVRHDLPLERKFSDAELAQAIASVAEAERNLYGDMAAMIGDRQP